MDGYARGPFLVACARIGGEAVGMTDREKLAGRCRCGVREDIAAEYPEDHLSCNGLKCCNSCGEAKKLNEYWQYKSRNGAPLPRCKVCEVKARRERRARLSEHERERVRATARKRYPNRKLDHLTYCAKYHEEHRDEILSRKRARFKEKRDAILAQQRERYRNSLEARRARKVAMEKNREEAA